MRTQDDLRAVLAALEEDAPTATDVLASLQLTERGAAYRRGRRTFALTAAAAAVVAVTVAVPMAVRSGPARPGPTSPPTAPRPAALDPCAPTSRPTTFQFFQLDAVAGLQLQLVKEVCPGRRETWVYTGGRLIGKVQVYARGAFDPTEVRRGRPVPVDGRRGYFGSISNPDRSHDLALAWPYAADAWAVVRQPAARAGTPRAVGDDFLALALRIAHAVHPETSRPLLLPFRIGQLPAGMIPAAAHSAVIPLYSSQFGSAGSLDFGDDRHRTALTVGVEGTTDTRLPARVGATRITVNGHEGQLFPAPIDAHARRLGGPRLAFMVNQWRVSLSVPVPDGRISAGELVGIARSMTIAASITDQATWFDAATAVP